MKIREASEKDIPQIVEVLKVSLGEDELQLSEEVWRFKHLNNPYGKSIVLLAVEGNTIVGVRAFMRWKWQQGNKQFSALRAVDTATHPEHQGKGIFKKLTLRAVDLAKTNNNHFIFNTPNDQSRPGYLKMGWEQVGKVYVGLKPSLSFLKPIKVQKIYKTEKKDSEQNIDDLCRVWNKKLEGGHGLFNPKSAEMLKWRYEQNPLQKYEVKAGKGYYLAAYVKKRGRLKEFRIAECIFDDKIIKEEELKKIIKKLIGRFGVHLISFSPNFINLGGKKGNLGPILTFNPLNLYPEEEKSFLKIEFWNNSLGDLELF